MSPLIDLKNVSWATPDGRSLFSDLTFAFGNEQTGLIGRNGVGKTTLLKLMTGELAPHSGHIFRSGRIGVLPQITGAAGLETVAAVMGVDQALARLARLETGKSLEDDLENADWTLQSRIHEVLNQVDLGGLQMDRPAQTLSGGQLTRLYLTALLLKEPDIILLDEPTNNLDTEGRAAVAAVLSGWKGGAVIISHDRTLLRRMDRIVELSGLGARVYGGNWDHYLDRKNAERETAARNLATADRSLRQVEDKINTARERKAKKDARGKRSRASKSQPKTLLDARKATAERSAGRADALAERQRADAAKALKDARREVEILTPLRMNMPQVNIPSGRRLLTFKDVGWQTPGGTIVLAAMSFTIVGPERVAVTGVNGAGKTTLLHLAAGIVQPTTGEIQQTDHLALLDQSVALIDPSQSVLENYRRFNPQQTDNEARATLARFLFRNREALKPVHALSGGERLRAGLACVVGGNRPPELLLLDEPTNHLDLDSIEVIEAAVAAYDGALIVVSHDEEFLRRIGIERRIELGDRAAH